MVEKTRTQIVVRMIAAMLGMAVSVSALAATLHVSPAAGGEGNGSAALPFASLAAAVEAAESGDTIVVHRGSYVVSSPVTVDKPGVKIIGISGERPTIAGDEKLPAVINIIASDVLLQDLTIQGGFYGVKIDVDGADRPTRGVIIRNCVIGSTAADCIKSFNADELLIEYCQIGPSGSRQKDNAEGIDIIGSQGVTVRGCVIQDVATNGVYLKGGTRDGLIERCLIRGAGHGGILLGQSTDEDYMRNGVEHEAIDCQARNNIVVDTTSAGIGTYSGKNVSFFNNTLVNVAQKSQAGVWIVTNSRQVPAEQVTLRNNIVVVGGDRPLMFVKDAVGLPDSDNNLFHTLTGEARFVREFSGQESMYRQWTFEQWQKATRKDRNSRLGDPKLDGRDYRPLAGSPAIGAGQGGSVTDDYFGRRRSDSSADVGAVMAAIEPARQ